MPASPFPPNGGIRSDDVGQGVEALQNERKEVEVE